MITRRLVAGSVSVVLAVAGLVAAPAVARADDFCDYSDRTRPVVTGYAPSVVSVGLAPRIVTFTVSASDECGIDNWSVGTGEGSAYAYRQNPTTKVYGWFNASAGLSYADVEVSDPAYNVTLKRFGFRLLRATYWSRFNAGPEPVKKGKQVRIAGTLKRADWDRNAWASYGAGSQRVAVQFLPAGGTAYATVKTVTLNRRSAVDTRITVRRSGTYRLVYAGNGVSAASISTGDFVAVR